MFNFRSSEFFWKNSLFFNLQKFHKKSLEISLNQKTLFVGQKKQGFWGQKQGFPDIPNLQ